MRGKQPCTSQVLLQVEPLVHCLGSTEALLRCFSVTKAKQGNGRHLAFAMFDVKVTYIHNARMMAFLFEAACQGQKQPFRSGFVQTTFVACASVSVKCQDMIGFTCEAWTDGMSTSAQKKGIASRADGNFSSNVCTLLDTGFTYAVCLVAGIFLQLGRLIDTQRHRKILQCTIFSADFISCRFPARYSILVLEIGNISIELSEYRVLCLHAFKQVCVSFLSSSFCNFSPPFCMGVYERVHGREPLKRTLWDA